jgi:hypothetical protein
VMTSVRPLFCASVILAATAGVGCRLTEVAIVTVRNETTADLTVHTRFPGDVEYNEDRLLRPADERAVLKYEEPRASVTPLSELVVGLRFRTAFGCITAPLESSALFGVSVRDNERRRWTVRITDELLRSKGCSPSPGVPTDK